MMQELPLVSLDTNPHISYHMTNQTHTPAMITSPSHGTNIQQSAIFFKQELQQ
jgi:hypothetical protein